MQINSLNIISKIFLIILIGLMSFSCGNKQQSFLEFIAEIEPLPAREQNRLLDEYVEKQKALPVIQEQTVCFLVKDTTHSKVYLSGDMCAWKPDSLQMNRVGQSSYYLLRRDFPGNARLEYKFVVGGKYILDPGNPLKDRGGYGENSLLIMPDYHFPGEVLIGRSQYITKLDTLVFKSPSLKNERSVYFYHHPQGNASSPLVVFQDGSDYLEFGRVNIILDNLISRGDIPPLNVLLVNPVERREEYWLNDAYLAMLFKELIPYIRKTYKLQDSAPLGLGGASLGGLISLYALKDYDSRLGFVFSQSGALWVNNHAISDILGKVPQISAKIYLDYGDYENSQAAHLHLAEILKNNNVQYKMNHYPEGHNWGNWRAHLASALKFALER